MSKEKLKKITITIPSPIMPGSISSAMAKCGNKKCGCRNNRDKRHGPYYRWTGLMNGKQTTKTISKEIADECERRIGNFRILQKKVKQLMVRSLENAPWQKSQEKV